MYASYYGNLAVLERLLAAGADPLAANADGVTAIMLAGMEGHLAVMERLIAAGAKLTAANADGWTALMFASKNGHFAALACLLPAPAHHEVATLEDLLERTRFPLPVLEYLSQKEAGRLALVSHTLRKAAAGALQGCRALTVGPYLPGSANPHSNGEGAKKSFAVSQR